ncbi:MAG TPA: flagellar hook-associated protein FlgK [Solirubrobacteraceae bacterium]|jgi:flagellar hook-associated protein 1 FlgK|nr:flagellar hook-associated protein FlgK [Solirubrobacteraceae bacterium]
MSIPTLQGLQTALSGLLAEQQAIDVTGHNIANVNTEGYSRQRAVLETNPAIVIPSLSTLTGHGAQLGTGVGVEGYVRIRNEYLDAQYRTQNGNLAGAETQTEELSQAQSAFNEPSEGGISNQLSAFWSAWNALASAPTSEAAKQGVVAAGEQLTRTLGALSTQLTAISEQATAQFQARAGASGEVQDYAGQIAQLNGQIKLAEEAGQQPNDMLDRRDLLIDKLSTLGQVTASKQADGTETVTFGDAAKPLVEGTTANWPQTITAAAGGELGSLLGLTGAGGQLAKYQTSLNTFAATLAESVNALHTSTPFFSGETAATLKVAVTAREVQTSSTEAAGGNDIALAISGLRGGVADQSYSALVEQLGSDVQGAQHESANLQTTVTAINNQRQGVAGVSLDEEMTNLISYQRGYQAAARTLTAMDSMLETLIEHTGVVGL